MSTFQKLKAGQATKENTAAKRPAAAAAAGVKRKAKEIEEDEYSDYYSDYSYSDYGSYYSSDEDDDDDDGEANEYVKDGFLVDEETESGASESETEDEERRAMTELNELISEQILSQPDLVAKLKKLQASGVPRDKAFTQVYNEWINTSTRPRRQIKKRELSEIEKEAQLALLGRASWSSAADRQDADALDDMTDDDDEDDKDWSENNETTDDDFQPTQKDLEEEADIDSDDLSDSDTD